nr:hypothetical protein [Tanacetum cinerariifolium]
MYCSSSRNSVRGTVAAAEVQYEVQRVQKKAVQ